MSRELSHFDEPISIADSTEPTNSKWLGDLIKHKKSPAKKDRDSTASENNDSNSITIPTAELGKSQSPAATPAEQPTLQNPSTKPVDQTPTAQTPAAKSTDLPSTKPTQSETVTKNAEQPSEITPKTAAPAKTEEKAPSSTTPEVTTRIFTQATPATSAPAKTEPTKDAVHTQDKSAPSTSQTDSKPTPPAPVVVPRRRDPLDPIPDKLPYREASPESGESQRQVTQMRDHAHMMVNYAIQVGMPARITQARTAIDHGDMAFTDYQQDLVVGNTEKALYDLNRSMDSYSNALQDTIPSNLYAIRAGYIDRQTMLQAGSPARLDNLIGQLQGAYNELNVECINGGFALFDSTLKNLPKNPDLVAQGNWDPVKSAIESAHNHGMKAVAWFPTFSAGNLELNDIPSMHAWIEKNTQWANPKIESAETTKADTNKKDVKADAKAHHDAKKTSQAHSAETYPGEAIAENQTLAITNPDGSMLPKLQNGGHQNEYWFSPPNPEARQFIKNELTEVMKYSWDGLQLDKIRYPFNGKDREMGYDNSGRKQFESTVNFKLSPNMTDEQRKTWINWKCEQVRSFKTEAFQIAKKAHPNILRGLAVFCTPLEERKNSIQQPYEEWLSDGDIDMITIMNYGTDEKVIRDQATATLKAVNNRALVVDGRILNRRHKGGSYEQQMDDWFLCTPGEATFTIGMHDKDSLDGLKSGPYRNETIVTPEDMPVSVAKLLFSDFTKHTSSESVWTDASDSQMGGTKLSGASSFRIQMLDDELSNLTEHSTYRELKDAQDKVDQLRDSIYIGFLSTEQFKQHNNKANFIMHSLYESCSIFAYAARRAELRELAAQRLEQARQEQIRQEQLRQEQVRQQQVPPAGAATGTTSTPQSTPSGSSPSPAVEMIAPSTPKASEPQLPPGSFSVDGRVIPASK